MGILILRPQDHYGLLTFAEGVESMRVGFEEFSRASVRLNNPRTRMNTEAGFRMTVHQGITPSIGGAVASVRGETVTILADGHQKYSGRGRPVFTLFDTNTGELLMVMIGEPKVTRYEHVHAIGGFHTACCAAYGTALMARSEATHVGVLGAGGQARLHLAALAAIRPVAEAVVYSPTLSHRENFATEMTEKLGIGVRATNSTQEVLDFSEILLVCTNSNIPVFDGSLLRPGTHVTSIVHSNKELLQSGLVKRMRQEIDDETLRRSAVVATTSKAQEELDQPEVIFGAAERGVIDWESVINISDIITGRVELPKDPMAITFLHNAAGWGIGAGAFFRAYYDKARIQGLGLDFDEVGGFEEVYGF